MQYDYFIKRVLDRSRLGDRATAERVAQATLETLGERVQAGAANNAAAQLPEELARSLRRSGSGTGERFGIDEFWSRVARRSGLDRDRAIDGARAVLQELRAALSVGEVNDLWAGLPGEFLTPFERPLDRSADAEHHRPEA